MRPRQVELKPVVLVDTAIDSTTLIISVDCRVVFVLGHARASPARIEMTKSRKIYHVV